MFFNSYEFIFAFLPITFLLYFLLNQKDYNRLAKVVLISSSLFFYSWQTLIYLPLILSSMIFNYTIGTALSRRANRVLLTFGIASNLSLLGYFKYRDFFIENVNLLFHTNGELLHLALPLAISFFTFQQISYLIDSYRGETKEYDFLNYALFVTFFPQLIAGPIVHHKEMMPQFADTKNRYINYQNIVMGIFIFSIGLFKKVVIADKFALWANTGFDTATTLNLLEAWATSLSYTFELYFDFSGYTDMAIGLALLFNIKLPVNFNSPYKAVNIQDFWRRWHITLSRFLRDYIYIPLGGNRKGELRTYSNLIITFLLGGLWHGAGWTFVFWGFLHGMALVIHKVWSRYGVKLYGWIGWFITFNFINIAWIFFRAKEWEDAIKVLKGMFSINHIVLPTFLESKLTFLHQYHIGFGNYLVNIQGKTETYLWIIITLIVLLYFKNSIERVERLQLNYRTALFASGAFILSIIYLNRASEFLYFNF